MTLWTYRATIDGIHDGDTVHLTIDLGFHMTFASWVRLRDCWAPELGSVKAPIAAGMAARDAIVRLCGLDPAGLHETPGYFGQHGNLLLGVGDEIPCTIQTVLADESDKYGRVLGTIWLGDDMSAPSLNAAMVTGGWATSSPA